MFDLRSYIDCPGGLVVRIVYFYEGRHQSGFLGRSFFTMGAALFVHISPYIHADVTLIS
jgi:hypothetical protein